MPRGLSGALRGTLHPILSVACVLACLAPTARAQSRAGELEQRKAALQAQLEALQQELVRLEEQIAAARGEDRAARVDAAQRGDMDAFRALISELAPGGGVIDYAYGLAARGGEAAAKVLEEEYHRKESVPLRCKLCWLLGQNGTPAAATVLRRILSESDDTAVIAGAIAALSRFAPNAENAACIRRFVGDERPITVQTTMVGHYTCGTLGQLAAECAGPAPDAQLATVPGRIVIEPPTLVCLGFEWHIEGDANENCRVDVAYRKTGAQEWRRGFPLLRCENRAHPEYKQHSGNLLAGSLIGLEEDTEYEVRLTLSDPDGGAAEEVVRARTRPEPPVYPGDRILHVVPGQGGGEGSEETPFKGLEAALKAARPGDVILLREGTYDGPRMIAKSGTADKPIVFRGADRDGVIVNPVGGKTCFGFSDQNNLHFEHMTLAGGEQVLMGYHTENIVVRNCRIREIGVLGICARGNQKGNSRNWYIADNHITGRVSWERGRRGGSYALALQGDGHVICYNRIENNFDDISLALGSAVGSEPRNVAIDIYGNDLRNATDDGVESDHITHNVRIFRNRLVNTFSSLSFQPVFGGPGYMLYNEMYNTTNTSFKLNVDPTGIVIAHNTCASATQGMRGGNFHNAFFRNNLLVGVNDKEGYWMATQCRKLDMDYMGYNRPSSSPLVKMNNVRYETMADVVRDTGLNRHSVEVGWDVFAKAPIPPGQQVQADPSSYDLRPAPGSKAIDAGEVLPGINDGFLGAAPDLGCHEFGAPLPHYGPRR